MDAGLAAIAGALVGGLIGCVGGSIERHWADKRRWDADRKGAYLQLLTQPLVLIWDANLMLERKRHPRDRNLSALAEFEQRMRAVVIEIGYAFGEVSSLAPAQTIAVANGILQASMQLVQAVTLNADAEALEAANAELSERRLAFLEEVRASWGPRGSRVCPSTPPDLVPQGGTVLAPRRSSEVLSNIRLVSEAKGALRWETRRTRSPSTLNTLNTPSTPSTPSTPKTHRVPKIPPSRLRDGK